MKYLTQLKEDIFSEDFYRTNETIKIIERDDNSIDYVKQLFLFMEENPDIDYGAPGPIVHYMEKFSMKGYEELLLESIIRKPTIHTLWMLNRAINDPSLPDRGKYLSVLEKVAGDGNISQEVREEAEGFLIFQNNNRKTK